MSTARLINYFVAQLSIFYRGFWLSSRCHIFRCLIHDPLTYDVRLYFMLYYKCVFIIIFGIVCIICTVVLCFKKMLNMVWFAIIIVVFAVDGLSPLSWCNIVALSPWGLFLFVQTSCVDQICRFIILHWHGLQGSDQVFVRGWQTLEQSLDFIVVYHGYI